MTYFLNRQQGRTSLQNNPLGQNSWILSPQSSWEGYHPCWSCVSVHMFSLQRGGHGRKATWRSGASLPQAGCQWSPFLINWWYDWCWWYIVSLIWNIDGYSINHSNSAVRSWIHYLYSLIHNTDSLASNNADSLAPKPIFPACPHLNLCLSLVWYYQTTTYPPCHHPVPGFNLEGHSIELNLHHPLYHGRHQRRQVARFH